MPAEEKTLTTLDKLVLEALTSSRRTASAVTLAATIWDPDHRGLLGADPIGLCQWLIEGLTERGLVKYRLTPKKHGEPSYYTGLAMDIRLTPRGWALMGYPHIGWQVQTAGSRQHWAHTGDRTNFRRHGDRAEGGAIEVDDFPTHQRNYPRHVHMYYEDDMSTTARRPYLKVTPEVERAIVSLKARNPDDNYADIAEEIGVPERTIKYILTELPHIRRNANEEAGEASLKQRILWALEAISFANVNDLRRVLGRGDDSHSIVHVLHSLHSEGKVDFTEKGAQKEPIRIHITGRGETAAIAEREKAAAQPEEEAPFIGEAIEPEQPAYPLLDELLERENKRLDGDVRAMAYVTAAEAIEKVDPEAAASLMQKAEGHSIPFASPLEAEYLRYVAEHS